jgi:hypothetical protein
MYHNDSVTALFPRIGNEAGQRTFMGSRLPFPCVILAGRKAVYPARGAAFHISPALGIAINVKSCRWRAGRSTLPRSCAGLPRPGKGVNPQSRAGAFFLSQPSDSLATSRHCIPRTGWLSLPYTRQIVS